MLKSHIVQFFLQKDRPFDVFYHEMYRFNEHCIIFNVYPSLVLTVFLRTIISFIAMNEKDIRKNIKSLRESRHLSQQKMADLLNIERNTYRNIENGPTKIINPVLFEISDILEVSVLRLLAGYELQEEDLRNLEELKVDYNNRVKEKENDYEGQLMDMQKLLDDKNEELKKAYAWLHDKDEIICLLKKRVSEKNQKIENQIDSENTNNQ